MKFEIGQIVILYRSNKVGKIVGKELWSGMWFYHIDVGTERMETDYAQFMAIATTAQKVLYGAINE